eukprot:TRINITY_DN8933_c0_g1_i1.p1 TRINITY_DN8933_c0_g1~~TRINITY_DN8933_c0_g1_i1.p1  ORF type:complete len:541 (+),score=70.42 TRINITY_DN8933_c0_g1_i1:34-1656(+)
MRWVATCAAFVCVMSAAAFWIAGYGEEGDIAARSIGNGTRTACSARGGQHPIFPDVACMGVCGVGTELFEPKDLRGSPTDVLCTRRDKTLWREIAFPVIQKKKSDWWLECVQTGIRIPDMQTPALLTVPPDDANICSSPERLVKHLSQAAPKTPKAVFVYTLTYPFSGSIKMAMASTVLYALAHGYPTVYYDAIDACGEWAQRVSKHGGVFKSPNKQEFCGTMGKRCCWVEGFYLHPNWVKPAALLAASRLYAATDWVVSIDIDATMRHLGYTIPAMAQHVSRMVFDPTHKCDGNSVGCNGNQHVLHKPNTVTGCREMIGEGMGLNTGVLLLSNEKNGRTRFLQEWWRLRNNDCTLEKTKLCRKDMHNCQKMMTRIYNSGDQSGLNLHGTKEMKANISEVPHNVFNGHGGLFAFHMYGGGTKTSGTDQRAFEEALPRHAAGVFTSLCDPHLNESTSCKNPKYVAMHPGDFTKPHMCFREYGHLWVEPAIAAMSFIKLKLPLEAQNGVSSQCFKFMNSFLSKWVISNSPRRQNPRRKRYTR